MKLDSLVMLLSTDWFSQCWATIAIYVAQQKRPLLQEGCRQIVHQILSGAETYWLTSFSLERRQATFQMLQELLQKSGIAKTNLDRISRLVVEEEYSAVDSGTRALLISLTGKLLADIGENTKRGVDPAIKEALLHVWDVWDRHSDEEIDFEELCLNSKSEWDQYTRGLTPDLPTFLSDYASAIIEEQDKFEILWNFISNNLTPRQRDELLRWYRSAAQSLTGREIDLPKLE